MLAGTTSGVWDDQRIGINDFAAVALDEDGLELWRYQVCGRAKFFWQFHDVLEEEA